MCIYVFGHSIDFFSVSIVDPGQPRSSSFCACQSHLWHDSRGQWLSLEGNSCRCHLGTLFPGEPYGHMRPRCVSTLRPMLGPPGLRPPGPQIAVYQPFSRPDKNWQVLRDGIFLCHDSSRLCSCNDAFLWMTCLFSFRHLRPRPKDNWVTTSLHQSPSENFVRWSTFLRLMCLMLCLMFHLMCICLILSQKNLMCETQLDPFGNPPGSPHLGRWQRHRLFICGAWFWQFFHHWDARSWGRMVAWQLPDICWLDSVPWGNWELSIGRCGHGTPRRSGECIPAETGAAPVHRSRPISICHQIFLMQFVARLDCGPQWKEFLNFAEYCNPEGVSLQERRMTCHFRC